MEMMKDHFSWQSTGKVFPKAPVWREKVSPVAIGVSNIITLRKMYDAERKELTVNIL